MWLLEAQALAHVATEPRLLRRPPGEVAVAHGGLRLRVGLVYSDDRVRQEETLGERVRQIEIGAVAHVLVGVGEPGALVRGAMPAHSPDEREALLSATSFEGVHGRLEIGFNQVKRALDPVQREPLSETNYVLPELAKTALDDPAATPAASFEVAPEPNGCNETLRRADRVGLGTGACVDEQELRTVDLRERAVPRREVPATPPTSDGLFQRGEVSSMRLRYSLTRRDLAMRFAIEDDLGLRIAEGNVEPPVPYHGVFIERFAPEDRPGLRPNRGLLSGQAREVLLLERVRSPAKDCRSDKEREQNGAHHQERANGEPLQNAPSARRQCHERTLSAPDAFVQPADAEPPTRPRRPRLSSRSMDVPRIEAESHLARALDRILGGLTVGATIDVEAAEFRDVAVALEYFLPAVLQLEHAFGESFDAFRFAVARKSGPRSAEFLGLALLITDQSWIPMDLHLELVARLPAVRSVTCRVGEVGDGVLGLATIPYGRREADRLLSGLLERRDKIDWVFETHAGPAPNTDRTRP